MCVMVGISVDIRKLGWDFFPFRAANGTKMISMLDTARDTAEVEGV